MNNNKTMTQSSQLRRWRKLFNPEKVSDNSNETRIRDVTVRENKKLKEPTFSM